MIKTRYKLVAVASLKYGDNIWHPVFNKVQRIGYEVARRIDDAVIHNEHIEYYGKAYVWKQTTLQTVQCSKPDAGRPCTGTYGYGFTSDLSDSVGGIVWYGSDPASQQADQTRVVTYVPQSVPESRPALRMMRGRDIQPGYNVTFPAVKLHKGEMSVLIHGVSVVIDPDRYYQVVNPVTK